MGLGLGGGLLYGTWATWWWTDQPPAASAEVTAGYVAVLLTAIGLGLLGGRRLPTPARPPKGEVAVLAGLVLTWATLAFGVPALWMTALLALPVGLSLWRLSPTPASKKMPRSLSGEAAAVLVAAGGFLLAAMLVYGPLLDAGVRPRTGPPILWVTTILGTLVWLAALVRRQPTAASIQPPPSTSSPS